MGESTMGRHSDIRKGYGYRYLAVAGIIFLVTTYTLGVLIGVIDSGHRIDGVHLGIFIAAGIFILMLLNPEVFDRIKTLEVSGFKVEMLEKKLNVVKEQISKQEDLLRNVIRYSMSASIFRHLCGLALLQTYNYADDTMRREMYFLRDHGFIKPKDNAPIHLDFLVFEQLPGKNLAEYAEPTDIGWSYLSIRKEEIPQDLVSDTQNLDPAAFRKIGAVR